MHATSPYTSHQDPTLPPLDAGLGEKVMHCDGPLLPNAVDAVDGLVEDAWVEGQVHDKTVVGARNVKADTACSHRQQQHDRVGAGVERRHARVPVVHCGCTVQPCHGHAVFPQMHLKLHRGNKKVCE
jgi:hypothetical protein